MYRNLGKQRQRVAVLVAAQLRQVELAADHGEIADDIAKRQVYRERMRHPALQESLQPRQSADDRAQLSRNLWRMRFAPSLACRLQVLSKGQRLFPQLHSYA